MPAVQPRLEQGLLHAVPQLLVELPSPPRAFFSNLREFVFPTRFPAHELHCAPGEFWPDVFVSGSLPWYRFLESGLYHGIAGALLIGLARLFSLQPHVVATPTFEHSQVVYYSASDFLPPLDTGETSFAQARKPDPEFSRQPIISVPPEADNRAQTIVTPPKVKLKRDVALPNMVAWAAEKQPRLAIPDAPLTPAAEIRRMPQMENAVVTPPPDAARVNPRRNTPALQNSVVAPPPELQYSNAAAALYPGLQPDLIAPPPEVDKASARRLGTMNIAPTAVIAPAPQLAVVAERSAPGGRVSGVGTPVVPPPPSLSTARSAGSSTGSPGRIIALSLHPVVSAPPEPASGNRRGTFAASPEGHAGSTASPGSAASVQANGAGVHEASSDKKDLPSGLYVGKTTEPPSAVAGTASTSKPNNSVNPNLIANSHPPKMTAPSAPSTGNAARLSEPEKTVFAGRKFYSLTLNMPNLNSAGGSWVIRFAEKNRAPRGLADAPPENLSQPMATKKVDPAYPLQLMRENVAGTVILYAVIHADGTVGSVRILRGVNDRLDRFAAEAVAKWIFQPAIKDGAPVDVDATFQIPFRPTRVGTNF